MMLIAGTIPVRDMPLITGVAEIESDHLVVDHHRFACGQGTGALLSAALATSGHVGVEPPHVVIAGDIGRGKGSRSIYEYLAENLPKIAPDVLVMHYILPDMAQMRGVCEAANRCKKKPIMLADAASMYAAKAAGLANDFDVFTPDPCELAFLADPEATHPAYIADYLFKADTAQVPELIMEAYRLGSAARVLLVKGAQDHIAQDGQILETVTDPDIPALEAIGGTGDTITGILASLLHAGMESRSAAIIAARANRMAGQLAQATPATRILQVIEQFPLVFREYLGAWNGDCAKNISVTSEAKQSP